MKEHMLSNKRRKMSAGKEYECSEGSDALNQDSDSKGDNEQDKDEKSDVQSSTISQDNRDGSRTNGLGRRRKKKVFADYYYGDDIFSKPKNGSKKKPSDKLTKQKSSSKKEKGIKSLEIKQSASKFKVKEPEPQITQKSTLNNVINLAANIISRNSISPLNSSQPIQSDFQVSNFSKDNQGVKPIKPKPQRPLGSNFDLLSNACRLTNASKFMPISQKYDEGLKKREDKELDKSLQNILSNSELPFSYNKSVGGLETMKETLAALLNLK